MPRSRRRRSRRRSSLEQLARCSRAGARRPRRRARGAGVCENFASSRLNASTSSLALDRLQGVADGAQLAAPRGCSRRPRRRAPGCAACRGLRLSRSSTARPEWSGRLHVEQDRARPVAGGQRPGPRRRCARPRTGSRARAPGRAGSSAKRGSSSMTRMRRAPRRQAVAVVVECRRRGARGCAGAAGVGAGVGRRSCRQRRGAARCGRRGVAAARAGCSTRGKVSVKVLPSPGALCTRDVAAEQARQVARDRQPEAGAAVLAVRAAVGLAERLEDHVLLLRRRCRCRCRAPRRRRCSSSRREDAQRDLAALGELERVRRAGCCRIWPTRCASVCSARRRAGIDARPRSAELLLRRQRLERSCAGPRRARATATVLGCDLDLAGLDLRQVEDVVDQRQQVVAGRVDRLGELHLLGAEVAVLVVGEQLGQDQRAS